MNIKIEIKNDPLEIIEEKDYGYQILFQVPESEESEVMNTKAKRKASRNKRFKKRRRMRYERNNETKICVKNEVEVEEESFSVDDEEKEIGIKEEYFNSDAKEKTEVNEECFNVKSEVKDPLEQVSSLDQSQSIVTETCTFKNEEFFKLSNSISRIKEEEEEEGSLEIEHDGTDSVLSDSREHDSGTDSVLNESRERDSGTDSFLNDSDKSEIKIW
ncbi:UNVERIFIED_CONTAM: hypothetical protein RMT77_015087 [Armadillidium vulgare]